jgi:hypothetical protein
MQKWISVNTLQKSCTVENHFRSFLVIFERFWAKWIFVKKETFYTNSKEVKAGLAQFASKLLNGVFGNSRHSGGGPDRAAIH